MRGVWFLLPLTCFLTVRGIVIGAAPPGYDEEAFARLSREEKVAYVVGVLEWRDAQLAEIDFEGTMDGVALDADKRTPLWHVEFQTKRKGQAYWARTKGTDGSGPEVRAQYNWNGSRSMLVRSQADHKRISGFVDQGEEATLRGNPYYQMLGFRMAANTSQTLVQWLTQPPADAPMTVDAFVESGKPGTPQLLRIEVIRAGYRRYALWIDPARTFLIVRYQVRAVDLDGTVLAWGDQELSAAKRIDDVWVPMGVVQSGGNGQPNGQQYWTCTSTISRFARRPISEAELRVEFPPGCEVVDSIEKIAYRIEPNGTRRLLPLYSPATGKVTVGGKPQQPETRPAEREHGVGTEHAVADAAMAVSASQGSRATSFVLSLGFAVLLSAGAGVAVTVYRRRQKRQ